MTTAKPLTIVAIITAVPGQEKLVTETIKEPDCLRYELHQALENRHLLIRHQWPTPCCGGRPRPI